VSSFKFSFDDLHLLWPRCDGAVRFLSYLLKPIQNGDLPHFTDKRLGRKFHKNPETIARWRARWKKMGILKSERRGGYTYYDIDLPALEKAILAARAARAQAEIEARAQALAQRAAQDAEIAQNLRQQCSEAIDASRYFMDFGTDQSETQQRTGSKEFSVNRGPGEEDDSHETFYETKEASLPKNKKQDDDDIGGNRSIGEPKQEASNLESPAKDYQWFLAAAQRLILASGEKWNKTLEQALMELDSDRLVNVVSAFWEQSLKGNVKNAAKWLNKAAQSAARGRPYRPSQKFRLPSLLPQLVVETRAATPTVISQSSLPQWLPNWAKAEVEHLLKTVGTLDKIFGVDGGVQVEWAGQQMFLADPQGPFHRACF